MVEHILSPRFEVVQISDATGLMEVLENTLDQANDQWATAEYRIEAASALLRRALATLEEVQA